MKLKTFIFFLSLIILGMCQPVAWSQGFSKPVMTKLTKNVYQHYYGHYTQLVVITKKGVVIVDPDGPKRAAELRKEIRKLTDKPVTHVIYSHEHHDHTGGGQIFKQEGAIFLTHEKCRVALKNDPLGHVVSPDITYSGETHRLIVGDTLIDLHHFGPSHGACMTVVHLPKENVLFLTDIHEPKSLTSAQYLPSSHYPGVYRTLKRIQSELQYDFVMASHAPKSSPEAFNEDVGMVEYLYNNVLKAFNSGKTAKETKQAISFPPLKGWQNAKDWPAHIARMYEGLDNGE